MATTAQDFDTLYQLAQVARKQRPRGRYAPSPTGPLHLGNVRTALLAWLQIRLVDGVFILRMEDLDLPRARAGSAAQILDDLRWLGLDWDEGPDLGGPLAPYTQSERTPLYQEALQRLINADRLYPCYCSRKDVALAASAPHAGDTTFIYPGTCRNGAPARPERDPAWRYRVPERVVSVVDEIAGPLAQTLHHEVGDFVVRRADRLFAYQLAVVVDDALMGITDVVRGVDLFDSTPRQAELFDALGTPVPRYWHVPLLLDATGRRLAKRDEAASLAALRGQGDSAPAIVGRLAAELQLIPPGTELGPRQLLARLDLPTFRHHLAAALQAQRATSHA